MIFAVAFLVSILWTMANQVGLHYFPWRKALGRELHRVAAYVLGVLGFLVPATLYLAFFGIVAKDVGSASMLMLISVSVVWLHVIAAGVAVLSCYVLDHKLHLEISLVEKDEELALMRQVHGAQG